MSTMTPPTEDTITNGQIGKVQDLVAASLRKSDLSRQGLQSLLENGASSFTKELDTLVRRHVEAHSELITRNVDLAAGVSVRDLIAKAGYKNSITDWVLDQLPAVQISGQTKLVFFKFKRDRTKNFKLQLADEYKTRGLIPADIQSVATCAGENQLPTLRALVVEIEFLSACDDQKELVKQFICFSDNTEVYTTGHKNINPEWMTFAGIQK